MITTLLVVLVSLFLLSVLSMVLTGYPERPHQDRSETEREGKDVEEPSLILFRVSPVSPKLYWRVLTADYYTGRNWLRTTEETAVEMFPQTQDTDATEVFTVEINTNKQETVLPVPPPISSLANMSATPVGESEFYMDTTGDVYTIVKSGQTEKVQLIYEVSWRDVELDDRLISLDDVPEDILSKYLQLPLLPIEVSKLAQDLRGLSYSTLDQVLADVQFLRTNFVYDFEQLRTGLVDAFEYSQLTYERISQGSDVSFFLERKKGICIDAATALAVILRMQKIPTRISIGYKPGRIEAGKLLYYTTGAHAVTEVYLPPYGWVQFDATPPLEESPLVKVAPFKSEASPGSQLFYQLSITNRRDTADSFRLLVEGRQEWNVEAAPENPYIAALQTVDALVEVSIPKEADVGEKNLLTITVFSLNQPETAFSILAIVQVENTPLTSTTITPAEMMKTVARGDTFWVNGTIIAANNEQVNNMTVFVFLTKGGKGEGMIVGKGFSEQGNFQVKSVLPTSMEVGDYKVLSLALGTTQYTASSSEAITRVKAKTRLKLATAKDVLLGYGAISGCLVWDNETGFAAAPVSFEVTSLTTQSEVWKAHNLTSESGFFRMEPVFENPGTYEVKATFSGDERAFKSNATQLIEVKLGVPIIQVSSGNIAIRGEVFNVTGKIQFDDAEVCSELVRVTFDDRLMITTETKSDGTFISSLFIDSEERLGIHNFVLALEKRNVSEVHKVVVKSTTVLNATVSNVAGGTFLLFSASVSDDHNRPIQGAEIEVDGYGLSSRTGGDGNLTLLLDPVKLWPGNVVMTVRFEGSKLYLPSIHEREIAVEPAISLPFLVPLVAPTLIAMGFIYTKNYLRRQRILRQRSNIEATKKGATAKEGTLRRLQEMQQIPQGPQPLKIVFPDIESRFPNVWGVRDKLRVKIVLDKSISEETRSEKVEVFIDEKNAAFIELAQQVDTEFFHVFDEKGEHTVQAVLPAESGRQARDVALKLRVVEYEEEIVRLYNELLRKLSGYDINTEDSMTAREVESAIFSRSAFAAKAIRTVTDCFEEAEYSDHPSTRRDYEAMYLSRMELEVNLGRKG